ncbi:prolipoprotein diacylglyceryl transferase [Rhodobacter sp. KR11]|uniref:prolipoprotein diacylglyceryl transferase family protein n=1 Tax=Rhodobacter sp. KR11 TaxID=2974588 RepID=UPI002223DE5D|nr:prolipoprotein diacylglyceryl transferase family protein [Rhodobacter sp. KR11]MCW1917537.1 prolipoprotein diacylglyceryl transferase [Rhodobacter sp. KR11]
MLWGLPVHLAFDLLAVVVAAGMTGLWWRLRSPGYTPGQGANPGDAAATKAPIGSLGPVAREGYLTALSLGILLGSYLLGTANLWLSGVPALGRSILGALTGGIIAVELYKSRSGIKGSTGGPLVPTFCALVIVGRIGCALSGLEDNTYGIPTALPWGVDFGDHIPRHPVAAYESLAMTAFLALAFALRHRPLFAAHGFHLMVGFYAAQRFGLEFLKPYAALLGPLNLFHMTCAGLVAYAVHMVRK